MQNKINAVEMGSISQRQTRMGVLIIGWMFFMFGFVSWINAILIPYFKIACELSNFESYFVTFAFYISYLIFSIPASYVLKKVGFKKGMMLGFWAMALGAFIFVPAAMTRTYGIFLLGLFSIGAGLALLQTAANPYITILGPRERAAQRFSIMGICNKGAGILAPLLFAAVIFKSSDETLFRQIPMMAAAQREIALNELIQRIIVPYACVGCFLVLLGLLIRFAPLPEINTEHESEDVAAANSSKKTILQFPHLILGAVAIFLHVGTQVISIDTIISYAVSMNISLLEAKVFPSYTLSATICSYIIGIICIPRFISQGNALRVSTVLGLILTLLIIYAKGQSNIMGHKADISIWFLALLGLANGLVWAGLWPLALEGLGRFTKLGASVMIMGLAGNAIMPLVYGSFIDDAGHRNAYWVLFPCYLYLIYYSFYGYSIRNWSFTKNEKKAALYSK